MYFNDVNIVFFIILAILRNICWRICKLDEQKITGK